MSHDYSQTHEKNSFNHSSLKCNLDELQNEFENNKQLSFSKLTKNEKIDFIKKRNFKSDKSINIHETLSQFWHQDSQIQKSFDELSENTLSNFYMPYGVAPQFLINNRIYTVPMAIEESSVVAAASKSAKFWSTRGGFKGKMVSTSKVGHVHFLYPGKFTELEHLFHLAIPIFQKEIAPIISRMQERGGGVNSILLVDLSDQIEDYFQIKVTFETVDAMGANFINSVLEKIASLWKEYLLKLNKEITIVMAILSNYTPECLARAQVDCKVKDLYDDSLGTLTAEEFSKKFLLATQIAKVDPYRATTHNKGIFNGIDSLVIATGNDFRAVEACGHAYASRNGKYEGLTSAKIEDDHFYFELELPLALGTVGGLTRLHPLAEFSLKLLGNPSASELSIIACSLGLAQNFAAIKSLVTSGIQKGHMKMHLMNILNELKANDYEKEAAKKFFSDKTISYSKVRSFLEHLRSLLN